MTNEEFKRRAEEAAVGIAMERGEAAQAPRGDEGNHASEEAVAGFQERQRREVEPESPTCSKAVPESDGASAEQGPGTEGEGFERGGRATGCTVEHRAGSDNAGGCVEVHVDFSDMQNTPESVAAGELRGEIRCGCGLSACAICREAERRAWEEASNMQAEAGEREAMPDRLLTDGDMEVCGTGEWGTDDDGPRFEVKTEATLGKGASFRSITVPDVSTGPEDGYAARDQMLDEAKRNEHAERVARVVIEDGVGISLVSPTDADAMDMLRRVESKIAELKARQPIEHIKIRIEKMNTDDKTNEPDGHTPEQKEQLEELGRRLDRLQEEGRAGGAVEIRRKLEEHVAERPTRVTEFDVLDGIVPKTVTQHTASTPGPACGICGATIHPARGGVARCSNLQCLAVSIRREHGWTEWWRPGQDKDAWRARQRRRECPESSCPCCGACVRDEDVPVTRGTWSCVNCGGCVPRAPYVKPEPPAPPAEVICDDCLSPLDFDHMEDNKYRVTLCEKCIGAHMQEGIEEGELREAEHYRAIDHGRSCRYLQACKRIYREWGNQWDDANNLRGELRKANARNRVQSKLLGELRDAPAERDAARAEVERLRDGILKGVGKYPGGAAFYLRALLDDKEGG